MPKETYVNTAGANSTDAVTLGIQTVEKYKSFAGFPIRAASPVQPMTCGGDIAKAKWADAMSTLMASCTHLKASCFETSPRAHATSIPGFPLLLQAPGLSNAIFMCFETRAFFPVCVYMSKSAKFVRSASYHASRDRVEAWFNRQKKFSVYVSQPHFLLCLFRSDIFEHAFPNSLCYD